MQSREKALEIVNKLGQEYPDAGTLLHFTSIFQLVAAVLLSAQSTDEQVNRVTSRLFALYPDPAAMAGARIEHLEEIIRPVGLFHNKARHLAALARVVEEIYQGQVPENLEELMHLPGVGRKSANVILAVGFGKPGLGVDTHVQRVANRLGLTNCKNPAKTELALKALLPEEVWSKTHHLLIFHGRRVCRARKPNCAGCVVEGCCEKHID